MKKYVWLKVVKSDNNDYRLMASNNDEHILYNERYESKLKAYQDCMIVWSASSVWQGCMTHNGYRIVTQ